ncbi:unnamed protein product [Heterobilharzia americana]|nr:unnamed protein product [Heterobilharzia americana]
MSSQTSQLDSSVVEVQIKPSYYILPSVSTFCQANQLCYNHGFSVGKQLTLPRKEDLKYLNISGNTLSFWMVYSTLLASQYDKPITWRYYDPSLKIIDIDQLRFTKFLPSNFKSIECCLISYGSVESFEVVACKTMRTVICIEQIHMNVKKYLNIDSAISVKRFKSERLTITGPVLFNDYGHGCYTTLARNTVLQCTIE